MKKVSSQKIKRYQQARDVKKPGKEELIGSVAEIDDALWDLLNIQMTEQIRKSKLKFKAAFRARKAAKLTQHDSRGDEGSETQPDSAYGPKAGLRAMGTRRKGVRVVEEYEERR